LEEKEISGEEEEREQEEEIKTVQLCLFQILDEEFGIDILQIQEIIKPQEITIVPSSPRFILGVINLRGMILPVININSFLGLEEPKDINKGEYLIVRDGKMLVGITVEAVLDILNVPEKHISIYEDDNPLRSENYILGKSRVYNREVNLLDLHRLLEDAKAII